MYGFLRIQHNVCVLAKRPLAERLIPRHAFLRRLYACSGRVSPMRSGLNALRSEPRYWKSSPWRGVQRSAKRSGGPLQMLGLLSPWKSSTDEVVGPSASAVEEVSKAAKSYEQNLAIIQSSSNLAEEAGKRATSVDVRFLLTHTLLCFVASLMAPVDLSTNMLFTNAHNGILPGKQTCPSCLFHPQDQARVQLRVLSSTHDFRIMTFLHHYG